MARISHRYSQRQPSQLQVKTKTTKEVSITLQPIFFKKMSSGQGEATYPVYTNN